MPTTAIVAIVIIVVIAAVILLNHRAHNVRAGTPSQPLPNNQVPGQENISTESPILGEVHIPGQPED